MRRGGAKVVSGTIAMAQKEFPFTGTATGHKMQGSFKAGEPNAHHLQNRSDQVAVYYDIGGRDPWDVSVFPDIGYEARTHMEVQFRPLKT